MKLNVLVKPNSRKEELVQIDEFNYQIKVHVPPEGGKANAKVIELLAKHLGIAKSKFSLIRGHKSKQKVIEVHTES